MSSMVCPGLQSCLEPQVSGLKVVTIKPRPLKPESSNTKDTKDDANPNADKGGWSFIQALTDNNSQSNSTQAKEEDQPKPYVHPHYTRSAYHLSNISLELCTETLGSESGSDNGGDIDIFSSSDSESNKSTTKQQSRPRRRNAMVSKEVTQKSLPPPLTSISGSNCYSIKPHREGGRLVMKAVLVPSSNGYFQAERRNGCLKLHYIRNSKNSPYSSDSDQESQKEEQEVENKGNKQEEIVENTENAVGGGEIEFQRQPYSSDSDQEPQEEEVENKANGEEEIIGNTEKGIVGGEVELQRPSRCKEGGRGNKGLLTWEPFWVAT